MAHCDAQWIGPRTSTCLTGPLYLRSWSIWQLSRTTLQGLSGSVAACRQDVPVASGGRFRRPVQFICHGNRHSRDLQGISARAMASICVHRALRTPPDSTPGHIDSRDGLQEDSRPDTELPHTALRARLVPCPTLSCNSSGAAIAILRASRAYRLAR